MLSNIAEFLFPCAQSKVRISTFGEFIHPLKLPSAYYVSHPVLSPEDKAIYKRTKIPALEGLHSGSGGERDNK